MKKLSPFVEEFIPASAEPLASYNQYTEWYKVNKRKVNFYKKNSSSSSSNNTIHIHNNINNNNQNNNNNYSTSTMGDDYEGNQNASSSLNDEIASLAESEEVHSVVESLFTQSSKGSGIRNESSAEERRLEQRQKQVDYGKNTIGYQRYLQAVPRSQRKCNDPQTPDKYSKCSKRAWDGLVRSWRRKLHNYDHTVL